MPEHPDNEAADGLLVEIREVIYALLIITHHLVLDILRNYYGIIIRNNVL